jgi:6-phosphogluconolactonase
VALAGGATPREAYRGIAADEMSGARRLPWACIHLFFGDERCVPPDHPESNFRMAREALLSQVPVPPENIHRMRGELEAAAAADDYQATLQSFFQPPPGEFPRFDLILLGLGADGHTASLFPGSPALLETRRLVCANPVPQLDTWRLTLTLPVLNAAAEVVFVVSGAEKAETLRRVLRGAPHAYPAQAVSPARGRLLWMADEAAARELGG